MVTLPIVMGNVDNIYFINVLANRFCFPLLDHHKSKFKCQFSCLQSAVQLLPQISMDNVKQAISLSPLG